MGEMTSQQRVQKAMNHMETDRVPLDLNGHRSSGIMVQAYKKLRQYLGLPPSELFVYDVVMQLALVEDDVLDIIGADVVEIGHYYYKKKDYWQDWQLQDGTPCKIPSFIKVERVKEGSVVYGDEGQVICIQKDGCLYFEQTYWPLKDSDDMTFERLPYYFQQVMWCRIGTPPAPAGFDEEGLKIWRETARALRGSTERAIYGTFGGNLLEVGEFCFGLDGFLYELKANPKRVHTFLDKLTELYLDSLTKFLGAVGEYVDIVGFGDDLGMQTGPLTSPAMYHEFFKPRHKLLWQHAKKLCPQIKTSLHCCGGVYPLMKDLIEAGLEVINPVQFTCKDMELSRLKKEFGRDIVFWGGGCDTRDILPRGTPEHIREHVRKNVDTMSPGGGFVFAQVHNIMADVPPENIVAMFEEARNYSSNN